MGEELCELRPPPQHGQVFLTASGAGLWLVAVGTVKSGYLQGNYLVESRLVAVAFASGGREIGSCAAGEGAGCDWLWSIPASADGEEQEPDGPGAGPAALLLLPRMRLGACLSLAEAGTNCTKQQGAHGSEFQLSHHK